MESRVRHGVCGRDVSVRGVGEARTEENGTVLAEPLTGPKTWVREPPLIGCDVVVNRGYYSCIGETGNVYDTTKYGWLQGRQV